MTTHRKIARIAGFAAALLCAGAVPAAAELQDCFRDGYLCSLKCVAPGADKSAAPQCETRCNEDEKVCLGKIAEKRGSQPAYSPMVAPMKVQWRASAAPSPAR